MQSSPTTPAFEPVHYERGGAAVKLHIFRQSVSSKRGQNGQGLIQRDQVKGYKYNMSDHPLQQQQTFFIWQFFLTMILSVACDPGHSLGLRQELSAKYTKVWSDKQDDFTH